MLDRDTCEMLRDAGLPQRIGVGVWVWFADGQRRCLGLSNTPDVSFDDNSWCIDPSSDELEAFARTLAEKLSGASPLDIRIRVDTWCNGSRASVSIRHAFGYLISYGGLVESAFLPDRSATLVALIRKLVEMEK